MASPLLPMDTEFADRTTKQSTGTKKKWIKHIRDRCTRVRKENDLNRNEKKKRKMKNRRNNNDPNEKNLSSVEKVSVCTREHVQ